MTANKAREYKPKNDDMPQEWADMREAAGEQAGTATLHRKNHEGKDSHLDTVPVGEVGRDPAVYLKRRFGGGDFRIYLRDRDGAYLKSTTIHISIEGEPKDPPPKEDKKKAAVENESMMIAMMHEGREDRRADRAEQSAKELAALAARTDPVAVVQAIVAAAGPMVTAFLARATPPPAPTMLEQVESMTAMMTLAQQMNGGNDGFGGLVKTLGEPIAKLVDAHISNPPAGTPANGAGVPQPEGPPVKRPEWFPIFEPVIPQLLGWARAGKDAALRADYVLDELPPHMIDAVYGYLTAEGFSDEFYKTVGPAGEFREWFGTFFDAMLGGITLEVPAELEAGDGAQPTGEVVGAEPEPEAVAEGAASE